MLKPATYFRLALLTGASLACLSPVTAQESSDDQGEELRQESVVVRGQFIPDEKRSTSEVSSLIDANDFQISGDADAASALSRVAGISTSEDARFVYVRGLNERYSGATLNGSPLPSPEPLRRVAPLDLFPTSVLESILVQKTFSPELPAEFGGGLVDIRTKTVPDEAFFEVSASVGGNSEATFQDGLLYDGGDLDFLGVSDNVRTPPRLPEDGEPDADFARSLTNDSSLLIMQEGTVGPDFSIDATGGQRYDLSNDISMGVLASASYSNSWATKQGTRGLANSAADGGLSVRTDNDFNSTENNIGVNGFATVGFDLFSNHEIRGTALITRSTDKEARTTQGVSIEGNLQRQDNLEWIERQLWTTQLSGEHFFPSLMDLSVSWRASYSEAQRNAPYQFSITYQDTGEGFQTLSNDEDTTFTFSTIDDDSTDLGIDLELPLERGGDCFLFCQTDLKAGYAYTENDRLATSRIFSLDGLPISSTRIDYLAADLYARGLLDSQSIGGRLFPEQYVATLEVDAGYAGFDTQITPFLRGAVGVRYERAIEAIDTRLLSVEDNSPPYESCIDNEPGEGCDYEYDLLPAVTITWNPFDDLQIRGGFSETITRPQFRELAPTEFLNTETDVTFQGNPFLVNAAIKNYDLRGEYYFARDQFITLGIFYKEMDRPIEEVNDRIGDDDITTFINVPSAELYGAELEYEQVLPIYSMFGLDWFQDRDVTVKANYTWSDSEVTAGRNPRDLGLGSDAFCAQFPDECVITSALVGTTATPNLLPGAGQIEDGRRLQGQSQHLFNLQLVYTDEAAGREANILINHASERIRSGEELSLGIPAVIEEPPTTVDFVLNQRFGYRGGDYEFTFKLKNLLGDEYEAYQERGGDRIDVDVYDIGTAVSFELKRRF
ncbi:TonB-dependent receptor domain-containing protein [Henriciella aquimarina]|uniref:TonB-dependent receptor domain-containing protein n=1 Tax=Henriciella aquimarina TaxID=545261 RepID=UPI0009FD9A58|nr:TonB-dependent receptor [Henriciella aquimarina]